MGLERCFGNVLTFQRLKNFCDNIIANLKNILLDVNANKSTLMIFGSKAETEMLVNDVTLKPSKTHKCLGLWLDNKLFWNVHIDQKCREALKKLSIRRYLGLTWGLSCQKLMTFYKATIVPTMTYACSVWAAAARKKRNVKKLRTCQRKFLQITLRAFPSVSFHSLAAISGSLPIELKSS